MVLYIDFDCYVASFLLQEATGIGWVGCLDLPLLQSMFFGSAVVNVKAMIVLCKIALVIFPWTA